MVINKTLTLTNANQGYSLRTLLGTLINEITMPRFASIRIQTQVSDVFTVPAEGAYTNAAGVPTEYGYKITTTNQFEEFFSNQNSLSVDEIILGTGTAGAKVNLFAYTN